MNNKILELLIKNGFYNLTKEERQAKHKEFIKNISNVLTSEEKEELVKILNQENPIIQAFINLNIVTKDNFHFDFRKEQAYGDNCKEKNPDYRFKFTL